MMDLARLYLLPVLAAFLGTFAFSVLFHVSRKHYLLCGIIGAAGWLVFMMVSPHLGVVEASFVATVSVVLLSRYFAIRNRCPVTLYLISGIFPLVPGAGIYWTAYYSLVDQAELAFSKGSETFQIAVAIVLGIVFISEIPQRFFELGSKRSAANR